MPVKYKGILKREKKLFNDYYEKVHNPNKTRHENIQNTINAVAKRLSEFTEEEKNKYNVSLVSVGVKALIDDLNGTLPHYFIKDLCLIDFLKNTEVKDTSIVEEYIKENSLDVGYDEERYYMAAIHTEKEGLLLFFIYDKNAVTVVVFEDDKSYRFLLKTTKKLEPICRMAINFIYYLKAFPNKIIDGVPQEMVKNDKKKFNAKYCHSIGVADEIVEKTEIVNGHIVIPHFRSGFFRHYTDDRYINMKGKVQFIAATMVKGKAKTVVV